MTTEVVNVKVKYIRPEYQNLKEWCEDERNVYIARRGVVFVDGVRYPPRDSPFANPFKIGKDGDRQEVLGKYYDYIVGLIKEGKVDLETLRGKRLGCWCRPELCHGDVLVKLLE